MSKDEPPYPLGEVIEDMDAVERIVHDASEHERHIGVHEGGGYYAERILRRALYRGTIVLGDVPE